MAHLYVLGTLSREDEDDGRSCLWNVRRGGNGNGGAWSVEEVRPEGHLPRPASMYNGLGENLQWRVILEKVGERRCDFRSGSWGQASNDERHRLVWFNFDIRIG